MARPRVGRADLEPVLAAHPFGALPVLAMVGVRARDIVGYTAIVMVFAGAWMLLGLVLF
jgi:short subunit fatty acids transporter